MPLRFAEFVATLALAQDNAFGQPLESQLRSCLLASWLCEAEGFDEPVANTAYWVALLRYVGCTGHAHEVASLFGDEIAVRAHTLLQDTANLQEVVRDATAFANAIGDRETGQRILQVIAHTLREWAVHNFASGCEVADMLVTRLNFGVEVRDALRFTFERWNGHGFPSGARAEAIPLSMRVVHLSQDMEAIGRVLSPEKAVAAARERRDRTYDPKLADRFVAEGRGWFERLAQLDPWDAVLALEPAPRRVLEGAALDAALLVAADFIDLKSPYMAGHSRRCAELCTDAGRVLGLPAAALTTLRQAALVHDFGTTAVPNSIWDKRGALTRSEFDRVELHPLLTEQMLRRTPALSALSSIAAAHHERGDGSGYHKRLRGEPEELGAALLCAADVYVGMTAERADRPALSVADAAAEVRRLAANGLLGARASQAVLAAAGHGGAPAAAVRAQNPGGLSRRELDVLVLAARGLTTQAIAARLFISPKTADHHIQHIYDKIGVSTRAAAALWAAQNDVVR
jgi:HD-GYP domain-containing protein (c-di-GMP phosphodiesterase class II)